MRSRVLTNNFIVSMSHFQMCRIYVFHDYNSYLLAPWRYNYKFVRAGRATSGPRPYAVGLMKDRLLESGFTERGQMKATPQSGSKMNNTLTYIYIYIYIYTYKNNRYV